MSVPMLNVSRARLPETYEAAKQALAECSRIDECKDWADKAAAMASYAKQADDDALFQYAKRIQARAVRRCGELLKTIEPSKGGRPPKNSGQSDPSLNGWIPGTGQSEPDLTGWIPQSRKEAAEAVGIGERQKKQALRVANIPQSDFNAAIESDNPPTVTALAEQGKKSRAPEPPEGFRQATHLIGTVKRFAAFCGEHEPEFVANGVMPQEADEIRGLVASIDHWLDRFVVNLRNGT